MRDLLTVIAALLIALLTAALVVPPFFDWGARRGSIEAALVWATEHGHIGVHPWEADLGIDPMPALAMARAYGREIGCYVVNEPARMALLAGLGLWGFVTDVPDVARDALGPRSG